MKLFAKVYEIQMLNMMNFAGKIRCLPREVFTTKM